MITQAQISTFFARVANASYWYGHQVGRVHRQERIGQPVEQIAADHGYLPDTCVTTRLFEAGYLDGYAMPDLWS